MALVRAFSSPPPSVLWSASVRAHRQRGSSLLFALIALALLALAAVAVTRSANTGSLIVGNLGFKQEASLASDSAAESAMTWLTNNVAGTTLHANGAQGSGYFATATDALDALNKKTTVAVGTSRAAVDWNGDNCASVSGNYTACLSPSDPPVNVGSNTARYIITRLCSTAGDPNAVGNSCASPLFAPTPDDQNRAGFDYSKPISLGDITVAPLYRIIVRTAGARGTASFTETIVHF